MNVNDAFIRFNLKYTTIKKNIKCYWELGQYIMIYKMSNNLIYKCKLNIYYMSCFPAFNRQLIILYNIMGMTALIN